MALSTQDITKGLDFTGLTTANASQHNQLVDLSVPTADSATEGKGLVIWTIDSALDTPIVPDAATTTKWVRYLWLRIPYAGATVKTPKIYGWNVDATSIATYLKWREVIADLTVVEAAIATLQTEMDAVELTAAIANAAAVSAQTLSNTAYNIAVAAQTDATAALALAGEPPADGSITAAMLANTLDLRDKTIDLPTGSVTADDLVNVLDLSGKTVTLPTVTVTNALAGARFTSVTTAIATGQMIEAAHGLGAVPKRVWAQLVCISVDGNFAVNDRIDADQAEQGTPAAQSFGYGANLTRAWLTYVSGSGILQVVDKTTAAIVNLDIAKWNVILFAEL